MSFISHIFSKVDGDWSHLCGDRDMWNYFLLRD